MAKRSFILFNDYADQFNALADADCGRLIKAIFLYENTGETSKLSPDANMAFLFIKNALDENRSKYEDVCKRRSEAGKKSGEVRKEIAMNKINKCSNSQTKRTDTDTDTETDTDTDTVTETVTDTDTDIKEKTPTHKETARGEFQNVFLTDEEYIKLIDKYGENYGNKCIELLSTRIARDNKYKNENHYATIQSWVYRAVLEEEAKNALLESKIKKTEPEKKHSSSFDGLDLEDFFEKV